MECQSYGGLCTYASGPPGTVDRTGDLTLTATAQRYIHDYMFIPPTSTSRTKNAGSPSSAGATSRTATRWSPKPRGVRPDRSVVADGHRRGAGATGGGAQHEAYRSRLRARQRVLASRCTSFPLSEFGHAVENCDQQQSATADTVGNVAVPIELRRIKCRYGIDCADPEWQCTVRLDGPDTPPFPVALVFDPHSPPPPAPAITVSPTPVPHVATTVTVRGHGFRPGHDAYITGPGVRCQCRSTGRPPSTTPLTVQRYSTANPETAEQPILDCARAGACSVTASTGPDDEAASAPIRFAAHSDDPTLLLDGATVVEGNGTTTTAFHVRLDRPGRCP